MRRIRLPVGRTILFGCLTLVALILFLPLSVALSALDLDEALTARETTGTVWSGNLREASFGGLPLGDVHVHLRPLTLLLGRARIDMSGASGTGALSVSRNTMGVDDATGRLALARTFAPMPLDALALEDVSVRFRSNRCDSAEGRVRATFTGDVAGLQLAQGLSGAVRCDAGVLLLPLVSQSAMERLTLRIGGDGHYRAELFVQSADPALAAKLTATGFALAPGGYALRLSGTF